MGQPDDTFGKLTAEKIFVLRFIIKGKRSTDDLSEEFKYNFEFGLQPESTPTRDKIFVSVEIEVPYKYPSSFILQEFNGKMSKHNSFQFYKFKFGISLLTES